MRFNLRYKINAAILFTFLVIGAIYISIQWPLLKHHNQSVSKRIEILLHTLVERDREPLANEMYQDLTRAIGTRLDQMLKVKGILSISVFDPTGKPMVARGQLPDTEPIPPPEKTALASHRQITYRNHAGQYCMVYTREIRVIGERVGYIRIFYSLEEIQRQERIYILAQAGMLGTILLVMLLVLNWIMTRTIVRPIATLRDTMLRMKDGRTEARVSIQSDDEIGDLSKAFNSMSGALAASYRESDRHRLRLQEAENYLANIIDSMPSMLLGVDKDLIVTKWNLRATQNTGISAAAASGKPLAGVFPQMAGRLNGILQALRDKSTRKEENVPWEIGGKNAFMDITIYPLITNGTAGAVIRLDDITDRKMTEEALRENQEKLFHAQKMEAVGVLAGGIAHDFNNLLQTIQGYSQLLLMKSEETKPFRPELEAIFNATARGGELAMQLLTFGRKVKSEPQPVSLNDRIEKVVSLMSRTLPKMIAIRLRLTPDPFIVNADPVQIEQILMNLIINAKDAMPEGGDLFIEMESLTVDETACRVHPVPTPGKYAVLTVTDTGRGISEEVRPHIFDPFFTTKATGKGTGLGLAVVYGIVKAHAGGVTCESLPGKGTTFRIYLPAAGARAASPSVPEPALPVGGSETILLVDDEETIRDVGKRLLEKFGYGVLLSPDGENALEIYEREGTGIHLVILDLNMPGMGGRKCLERLLALNPEVNVIVSSGYLSEEGLKTAPQPGTKGFIKKPYDLTDMLREVRRVLDGEAA